MVMYRHRMRRLLVIFLILLFPLNVVALSMSVALAQPGGGAGHATLAASAEVSPAAADTFDCDVQCDIDPDEPPSVADLHDLVHQDGSPNLAGLGARAVPPRDAARHCHSLPPPIKPPRLA